MNAQNSHSRQRQSGAAILMAMLAVTLVASFAAAALWQQWRSAETERAERQRAQLNWILNGALDWARLILIEDARTGDTDHLSEPWAVPLREARLSSFLAAGSTEDAGTLEAYLSGSITDEQAMLNVSGLVQGGQIHKPTLDAFENLFQMLGLPTEHLQLLVQGLEKTDPAANATNAGALGKPLPPARMNQLAWLGVPASTLDALAPYVTLLPTASPVNINTASTSVLRAVFARADPSRIQQLISRRSTRHFKNTAEVIAFLELDSAQLDTGLISTSTRYFSVLGRLRLDQTTAQEKSLLERSAQKVSVIWRSREAVVVN